MSLLETVDRELNPFPVYAEMRSAHPVYFDETTRHWSVFRFQDVQRVLSEYETFSSQFAGDPDDPQGMFAASMISSDPPRHRELRSLVTKAFTPKAIEALAPRVKTIVDEHLDKVRGQGGMDVIGDLGYPLPVIVIAELMGIPAQDREKFKHWSDQIVQLGNVAGEFDYKAFQTHGGAIMEMGQYFMGLINERTQDPQDDLITGLLQAEVDGRHLDMIEPGLTPSAWSSRFEAPREGKSRIAIESQLRAKDGRLWPVELTWAVASAGTEHAIVFAHNIGPRREAQEAAVQTRRHLSWVMEALGQSAWEQNLQTGDGEISPQWFEALGYAPTDVQATAEFWRGLIHPDDAEVVRAADERLLQGLTPLVSVEYRVRAKSGDWRWMLDRATVVERSPDGAPVRLAGICTDITGVKLAEEENREVARFVSILFDTAPVGIVALGPDRLVRMWNAAAERIFGWSAAEAIGKPLPTLRPESAENFERNWAETLSGRSMIGVERPAVRKDGRKLTIRLSTVPLFGSDGKPSAVLGLCEDVTEQKQLEAQLLQAQRLENIGRLAGAVAHDFNNLLTVINGYGEIALSALDPRDPLYESIKEIKSAGDRAAVLTQQLLAFSRRQVMQAKRLNVNDVVREMELMLRRLIGEDIDLALACDSTAGEVKADPVQIQQVIMNLAVNARDAMPQGGRLEIATGNVELTEEVTRAHPDVPPGAYVRLSVTDTGAGMDEDTLARVFEPFFTTKEKGKGTGLGLSTVYGIVKQSGGHVVARSELGKGSCLTVYLPRVEPEADAAANAQQPETQAAASGHETILLVEDQAEVRQLAVHALGMYGYDVLAAANGTEALEVLRRKTPVDLVLTDVVMPGMAGTDLALEIAAIRPGVQVLLMSGYTDQAALPNDIDYIQKPFTPESLARKVRETLDARPATEAPKPAAGRILVVDDEAEIRKLLRQVLEHAGYAVAEAADGRRAVEEADAGGVALVITDLVMPEKEGIETIREMRRNHPEVKIIAMSGAFGGRFLRTAEMLGAHATLSKPVKPDVLVQAVRDVLSR